MKILAQFPLLLVVLAVYSIAAIISPHWLNIAVPEAPADAPSSEETLADEVFKPTEVKPAFAVQLVSGKTWGLTFGEVLIVAALVLLFVEIFKSTRTSVASIVDHLLSTFVFIIYLVLFLVWDRAATGVFFILFMVSLIDVLCGFTVSISSARRDISLGN